MTYASTILTYHTSTIIGLHEFSWNKISWHSDPQMLRLSRETTCASGEPERVDVATGRERACMGLSRSVGYLVVGSGRFRRLSTDHGDLQTLTNLLCHVREKLQTDLNLFEVRKNNLNCLLDEITILRGQFSTRLEKEDVTGDTRQHVSLLSVNRFHTRRTLPQGPLKSWFNWWERWRNWGSCSRLMSVSPTQSVRRSPEYTGTTDSDEMLSPLTLIGNDWASAASWRIPGTLVCLVNLPPLRSPGSVWRTSLWPLSWGNLVRPLGLSGRFWLKRAFFEGARSKIESFDVITVIQKMCVLQITGCIHRF
jgi:hypothetical protein